MERLDNPPAFPLPMGDENINANCAGMSLRDYFAAKAMQGIVTSEEYQSGAWDFKEISLQSYRIADAMLSERQKPRVEGV